MPIIFNGTNEEILNYNTTKIDLANYNGTPVYESTKSKIVFMGPETFQTEMSVVPPPYDANGYNYNDEAPKKERTYWLNGDENPVVLTDGPYNFLEITADNTGSFNAFGYVSVYVMCRDLDTGGFNRMMQLDLNPNDTGSKRFRMNLHDYISDRDYGHRFEFYLEMIAQSNSSSKYFGTQGVLTISNCVLKEN